MKTTELVEIHVSLRADLLRGEHVLDLVEMWRILQSVDDTHSIVAAAAALNMTYRTLWGRLDFYAKVLGRSLVDKAPGLGTRLTRLGRGMLATFEANGDLLRFPAQAINAKLSEALNATLHGVDQAPWRLKASHDFALAKCFLGKNVFKNVECAFTGSVSSAQSLMRGDADLAGFHVPAQKLGVANDPVLIQLEAHPDFWTRPVMAREQGILVAQGNPNHIYTLADLTRPGVRFINRQRGSGTRILLDQLLAQNGLAGSAIDGYDQEEFTHQAVAAMIAAGAADAGLGLRAAASLFHLDFVPLGTETYFLAGSRALENTALVATLIEHMHAQAADLAGYRVITQ